MLAGLSTLVGLITPITAFLGADAAVHMAEELRDASRTLPKVMMWTSGVNGALGFIMLVYVLKALYPVSASANCYTVPSSTLLAIWRVCSPHQLAFPTSRSSITPLVQREEQPP